METLYGPIDLVHRTWSRANEFMVKYYVPAQLQESFRYMNLPTKMIYVNKHLAVPLTNAMNNVIGMGLEHLITSFDGCFNIRATRGSDRVSVHAYALAIDLNAAENKLGQTPTMDPRIVDCFEQAGFVWGGRWKRPDGQHFQFVTEDL